MGLEESAWTDSLVTALDRLDATARPHVLADMAMAYYLARGDNDPVEVARWRVDPLGLPRDAIPEGLSDRNRHVP